MAEIVSGMAGSLQGTATGVLSQGQNYLDKFFPPEKRNELSAKISKFATEKPMFASFLLSQIALSGVPLGLFVVMTITVLVFALVAALVIGVLGALLFTAFCVGVALLVLLPVLFITTFAGAFIWLWGVGAYFILKWFNKKEIPGVHTDMKDGIMGEGGPLGDLKALNGSANGHPPEAKKADATAEKKSEKHANGAADKKSSGKTTGSDAGGVPDLKKSADIGNAAGKAANAGGDVQKKADLSKAKGAIPGGVL
ncbi:hypothetical protein MMC06_001028 [Schaereria dolodes]|nr:hypothetical protein [Schaereria dolodes]